jgi:hypothetical protein
VFSHHEPPVVQCNKIPEMLRSNGPSQQGHNLQWQEGIPMESLLAQINEACYCVLPSSGLLNHPLSTA